MSGSEVVGCINVVISGFRDASDLAAALTKRIKKRRDERTFQESMFRLALEQGESQIWERFSAGCVRLGKGFQEGDGMFVGHLYALTSTDSS